MSIYKDMLKFYHLYNCWSNFYREADLWNKSSEEKVAMAKQQGELFAKRDEYVQYKYAERAFLSKYTSMRYEKSPRLTHKRAEAYRERYQIPRSVIMQYGLILMTEHYTIGQLKVGENCLLGRNVDIDYTGGLELSDSVSLMDGVKILTHAHDSFNINSDNDYLPFSNYAFATPLKIGKNTSIGSRSIILPGVGEIGENVMVSAGSVVKEKVPSNCIVAGNPAKIVAKIPNGTTVEAIKFATAGTYNIPVVGNENVVGVAFRGDILRQRSTLKTDGSNYHIVSQETKFDVASERYY